jgi:hypothetical protein
LITLAVDPKARADSQTIGITPTESPKIPFNFDAQTALHDIALTFQGPSRCRHGLSERPPPPRSFRTASDVNPAIDKLVGIAVLPDRIRITANARGYLRFVYER